MWASSICGDYSTTIDAGADNPHTAALAYLHSSIEQERRRVVLIHPAQHVARVLAPVLLTQPQREGGRTAAGEHADGAVAGLEPMLDVERFPGTAFLVLGKGDVGIGVVIALRAHI